METAAAGRLLVLLMALSVVAKAFVLPSSRSSLPSLQRAPAAALGVWRQQQAALLAPRPTTCLYSSSSSSSSSQPEVSADDDGCVRACVRASDHWSFDGDTSLHQWPNRHRPVGPGRGTNRSRRTCKCMYVHSHDDSLTTNHFPHINARYDQLPTSSLHTCMDMCTHHNRMPSNSIKLPYPKIGDVVQFPGKWEGERGIGQIRFLQRIQ